MTAGMVLRTLPVFSGHPSDTHHQDADRDRAVARQSGEMALPVRPGGKTTPRCAFRFRCYGSNRHHHIPSLSNKPLPWATSIGLGLTEDRLRLDRLPATAVASFFPPPAALHRQTKKPSPAAFHCVPALRVRSDRLRSNDPHRGRERRG